MQISSSATKAYKCMFQPIKTFNLSFLFFKKEELIYDSYFKVLKFNSCP